MGQIQSSLGFIATFIDTTLRMVQVSLYASGHLLLLASIFSLITGNEALLNTVIDGSLLRIAVYSVPVILAASIGIGFVAASFKTFTTDAQIVQARLGGQNFNKRHTAS